MTNKTKRLKDMEVGDIIGVPYYDMPSYRALVNKLEKTTSYRFKISGYNITRLDDSNIKKAKQRFTREEVETLIHKAIYELTLANGEPVYVEAYEINNWIKENL